MQVLRQYPETIPVFGEFGFGCLGCAGAAMETIEQGAMAHGIDVEKLVNALNKAIEEKKD